MTQVQPTNSVSAPAVPAESAVVQAIVERAKNTGHYGAATAFVLQALGAQTLEQATEIGAVLSGKDNTGRRMKFLDATFLDSDPDLDSPIPLFAVCDVVFDDGDGVVEKLSIGAGHVVGVLIRAVEMDWFPFDGELVSVDLGAGKKAINLQVAPRKVGSDPDF